MSALMTPHEIVHELDKHIIGQERAKKSVAIALRNRYRRAQVDEPLRSEIIPKNILMMGPTGVGKTEISRRLAKMADAPFIKVEATKFTEVGYVGRDVDSIIRDLTVLAMKNIRAREIEKNRARAQKAAEDRVLDVLLPPPSGAGFEGELCDQENPTRQKFRQKLRDGDLNDKEIEIELPKSSPSVSVMGPMGMEDFSSHLEDLFAGMQSERKQKRKVKVSEALCILIDEEAAHLINEEELHRQVIEAVEQNGIVFIDEIDKVTSTEMRGGDVSRQGVQRDLLPLVEGTSVSTKYGMVKTDHILFIASGAFHLSKPSDLIPELQGRFPIRVELDSLSVDDFKAILTRTDSCLIAQYKALLAADGVQLEFTDEAIERLAQLAFQVNTQTEDIGARRLHTVLEKLLEEVSFEIPSGITHIDATYVDEKLVNIVQNQDLARYIL